MYNRVQPNRQLRIEWNKDRKERAMREGERDRESTKGKGGLYNMPQYSTIPQKWPRSGVTFHYLLKINC